VIKELILHLFGAMFAHIVHDAPTSAVQQTVEMLEQMAMV
jgi:hypothetical protein